MVLKLVKDTLAWVESKQGTKKAGTAATALSVTGSIVQVGDKYRVFESFKDNVKWPSRIKGSLPAQIYSFDSTGSDFFESFLS